MTLILSGTDNSVSSPAVQGGTAGTTTGVYYPAANQVALATNGTLALIVDASQNVGIGTPTPADILHLSSASPRLTFTSTNNTSGARYNTVGTATAGSHRFQYGGTEVLTVGISGQTIALQNGTVSSGTGIAFPATQSASTDANTLDDYEEGTWTPTAVNVTTAGSVSYYGWYVKIGRLVYIGVKISMGSGASFTSTLNSSYFSNIPFSVSSNEHSVGGMSSNAIKNFGMCVVYNNTQLYLATSSMTQAADVSGFVSATYATTT